MKHLYVISFLLLFHFCASSVFAQADPWVYGEWSYRRLIIVNNPAQKSKADYAIPITLLPTNFDFSKANLDGSDIRFASKTGAKLNYYQREFIPGEKGKFNVKLDVLNADGNELYIYYANPMATLSESSGKNTFDYYESYDAFNPTVKFGLFTDIHHDGDDYNYWNAPDAFPAALTDAQSRMNRITDESEKWGADFLISLGDLITSEDFSNPEGSPGNLALVGGHTADNNNDARRDLVEIEAEYLKFNGPRYYVSSNHEFYSLSEAEVIASNDSILGGQGAVGSIPGVKKSYYRFDAGGVRFIITDTQYDPDDPSRHRGPERDHTDVKTTDADGFYGEGYMPQEQLDWLEGELEESTVPVIVFSASHLEPNDFLETEESQVDQCQVYSQFNNYCTNLDCIADPDTCIQMCKDFGHFRRVRNAAAIRTVLEKHKDKVILVFQGNDHASAHYVHEGIHYITADGADNEHPTLLPSFLKVKIDSSNHLIAIEGVGENNTFKIDYEDGSMILENQIANYFIAPPIPYQRTWQNDVMIDVDWEINPQSPAQQFAAGFYSDMDRIKISHRCASEGRDRRFNLAGIRRVYANKSPYNWIGTQVVSQGFSSVTLDKDDASTAGHFWSMLTDSFVYYWYQTPLGGGSMSTELVSSADLYPGVWVWDDTSGTSRAKVDNLIIRTAVYPEPSTVLGEEEKVPQYLEDFDHDGDVDFIDLLVQIRNFSLSGLGNLNMNSVVDIFDYSEFIAKLM